MNKSPLANSLSFSVRTYRALLVAYPKTFREHYETQMVQVFRDSFREASHNNGIPGLIDLWIHTFVDLVFTALKERIMERSQYMFSPKVVLWGGMASVFSGMLWMMGGLAPSTADATMLFALVLGLGGLVGLYSRQARQGGILGLAGFALGIIGTILVLAADWWSSTFFSGPNYAVINLRIEKELALAAQTTLVSSLAFLTLGIGLALLGVASLRAKTLHRWRGLPLGLGLLHTMLVIAIWSIIYVPLSQGQNPWNPWTPAAYLPIFALFVLLGIGWMGLGFTLATEAEAGISQLPSAST